MQSANASDYALRLKRVTVIHLMMENVTFFAIQRTLAALPANFGTTEIAGPGSRYDWETAKREVHWFRCYNFQ